MQITDRCDVLVVVTEFGGGGTERYAEDVAVGLNRSGIGVAVTVDNGGLERVRDLTAAGIPIFNLAISEKKAHSEYRRALEAVIRQLSPRIIHANTWRYHEDTARSAATCGVPLLFTSHTTPVAPRLREWLGIGRPPFGLYRERALLRKSSAICVSKLGLRNFRMRNGARVRATAVYCGVAIPEPASRIDHPTDAPRVIWVGSLTDRKRPLMAIKAFLRVLPRFPRARLVIVGDGPLSDAVRSAAERSSAGAIEIAGFRRSVMEMMDESDIYIQTSVAEGIAYTVMEAMAAGLPVIATDAGATREAVQHGETGLVCRRDDVEGLARSLDMLMGSADLRLQYGRKGRERARALFSVDRMISETLAAYGQLCGVHLGVSRMKPK